jgi:dCTP deaminase
MGHALDNKRRLTDGFFATHPVSLPQSELVPEWTKKSTDWVSELYADQIGIAVAGPAYLLGFVTWYLSSRYLAPKKYRDQALKQDSHPLPGSRVSIMKEYLNTNGLLTDGVKLGLELFEAVKTIFGEPDPEAFRPIGVSDDDVVSEARSSLSGELSGHLAKFSSANVKTVDILVKMLDRKITIPSRFSETPERIAEELGSVSERGFRDRDECFKVARFLREEPNHSAEIVNAGWEHKLTKGREEFREIFSDTQRNFSSRFEEYERCLNNLETRLRKSVETSRMHKRWQDEMQNIGSDVSSQSRSGSSGAVDNKPPTNAEAGSQPRSPSGFAQRRTEPSLLNEKQILERLSPRHPARIVVTPVLDLEQQLQPSSLDLRLGTEFALIRSSELEFLNILAKEDAAKREMAKYIEMVHLPGHGEFALHPGEFALGCTLEFIVLPSDIAGRLEGKSTWGRVGLQIHSTAGFVDPGFHGALTFELQNVGRVPIPLYPGMRVAQICFFECERSSIPYGGKARSSYGGDPGLISSRYYAPIDAEILRRIHPPKEAPEKVLTDIKALIAKNLGKEAAKNVIAELERAASQLLNSGALRRG